MALKFHVFILHCTIYSIYFLFLDIRRRIELLQDFEMPIASTNVCVSADKQYIMASGKDFLLLAVLHTDHKWTKTGTWAWPAKQ